jgi:hypothetical protein
VKELSIFKTEVKRQPLNLAEPPPLKMNQVEFHVVTRDNSGKVFDDLKKKKVDEAIIGLTDDGYEILAINFAKIRNYIVMQKEIIKKYKNYYEGENVDGRAGTKKGNN